MDFAKIAAWLFTRGFIAALVLFAVYAVLSILFPFIEELLKIITDIAAYHEAEKEYRTTYNDNTHKKRKK